MSNNPNYFVIDHFVLSQIVNYVSLSGEECSSNFKVKCNLIF